MRGGALGDGSGPVGISSRSNASAILCYVSEEDKWDEEQLQTSDLERLKGSTILQASLGRVEGFEYDAITLELDDGCILQIAPWDYEGYSAGLYKRWIDAQ